jgi:hypothetical protein
VSKLPSDDEQRDLAHRLHALELENAALEREIRLGPFWESALIWTLVAILFVSPFVGCVVGGRWSVAHQYQFSPKR